jgi:hypothetical protein
MSDPDGRELVFGLNNREVVLPCLRILAVALAKALE